MWWCRLPWLMLIISTSFSLAACVIDDPARLHCSLSLSYFEQLASTEPLYIHSFAVLLSQNAAGGHSYQYIPCKIRIPRHRSLL
ncbi:hypothetical protein R3P38DRAFT_1031963 [Favolaschia claudopus]|uniref:Secreted protein n=1 Tax=Favolaschia claudopus TaxID=2862362 RepID=A0AAW0BLB4_9AGAR